MTSVMLRQSSVHHELGSLFFCNAAIFFSKNLKKHHNSGPQQDKHHGPIKHIIVMVGHGGEIDLYSAIYLLTRFIVNNPV